MGLIDCLVVVAEEHIHLRRATKRQRGVGIDRQRLVERAERGVKIAPQKGEDEGGGGQGGRIICPGRYCFPCVMYCGRLLRRIAAAPRELNVMAVGG